MSRVSNYLNNTNSSTTQMPTTTVGKGRVSDYLKSKNIANVQPQQNVIKKKNTNILSKIINTLLAPQRATTGLIQKGLETIGVLEKKTPGLGIKSGVQNQLSNIDTLERIGAEKKPQSQIGKLLTGTYEPSKNFWGNFVRELPKATVGTVADVFLDPTLALGKLGIIGRATAKVGEYVAKPFKALSESMPAVEKIGKVFERVFITRGGQSKAFQIIDKKRILSEFENLDKTKKLVSTIIESPKAIQQRIAQVIKGGITTDDGISALAQPIREELDRVGKSISQLAPELLSPEKVQANLGRYFPRLYTSKELPTDEVKRIEQFFSSKPLTGPNARFKARKDISENIRQQMGEIKEAGLPSARGLLELGTKEARLKAFDDYVKSGVPVDEPIKDFIQLPDSKGLGSLAGKYVPPADASAILRMSKEKSVLEEIYDNSLSTWKTFKTAYSPATISRNDLTNWLILNPLGGVGPHRIDIYTKAARELFNKGSLYQRAAKQGLELTTQEAAELTTRAKQLYQQSTPVKQFFSKFTDFHKSVTRFYGNQDKFFKLSNFIKGVTEDGLKDARAMSRANFYLVDYSEVPEFIKWARKSPWGIPFISFTYGVSKPLAKTLLTRPDKLSAYFKVLNGISSINPTHDTKEKIRAEQMGLPDYLQGSSKSLRVPFKDRFGRSQYLNLQYILPFNALESGGLRPLSHPVTAMVSDILRNKSVFSGQEIWKEGSDTGEIVRSIFDYAQKAILPPVAPGVPLKVGGVQQYGGTSLNKIIQSLKGVAESKSLTSKPRQIPQTILETIFGLKLSPVDLETSLINLQKRSEAQMNDIKTIIRSVIKNNQLNAEQKRNEVLRIINSLKN